MSRDPLGYAGGLNLYAYAGNDPVNNADPLGLWSWPSWQTVATAVAAVAVGVAVVVLAPVALPAAIILAGAAAGAVAFGLNQALNEKEFCATCIALEALKGAGVGAIAALPFAFLPATAGVAAFAGRGALSGALGYTGGVLTHPGTHWNWSDFEWSVGVGAITAGAGRFITGRLSPASARLPQDEAVRIGCTETAVESKTTPLFRAVLPEEARSIGKTGAFSNPLGIESKYFSTTLEGAQSYASQATSAFGDGPFSFFSTEIPTAAITPEMKVIVDRGINTIVISSEDLVKLSPPKFADISKWVKP